MNGGQQFTGPLRFGVFEVHQGELRRQGVKVKLQDQPFQLLLILLEHAGKIVTREELQKRLWPADTFVDFDRGLNRAVNKLRDVLGDSSENPRWIETIPRRGYRFLAPPEFGGPLLPPSAAPPLSPATSHLKPRTGLFLAAALLLAITTTLITRNLFESPPSLAVLPLQSLSPDSSHEYFADGMTDGLITEIARIRSLRVLSRTSVMHYKGTTKSLPILARELGADFIVEGTILPIGDKVRITAQLIRASDDRHIWSERYERDLRDTLKLQSEVAETIASQIRIKIAPQERIAFRRNRQVTQPAFEAYAEGSYFGSRTSEESLNKSVELLGKAVELEPGYAQAHAGLSHSYYVLGMLGMRPPGEAYPAAKAAALHALELDDTVAEAHNTLAEVERGYLFDWLAAEKHFQQALRLNPSYALAHSGYAGVLSNLGRHKQAIAEAMRARELDPISVSSNTALARILYRARRYPESIAAARKAIELDATDASPLWWTALSLEQQGQLPLAIELLERATTLSHRSTLSLALLAHAYASAAQPSKAEGILDELNTRSRTSYVSPVDLAVVYTGLRDPESAFHWLDKAYQLRTMRIQQLTEPLFDNLRGDPRFRTLANRLNLAM